MRAQKLQERESKRAAWEFGCLYTRYTQYHCGSRFHKAKQQGFAPGDGLAGIIQVLETRVVGLQRTENGGRFGGLSEGFGGVDAPHIDLAEVAEGETTLAIDLWIEADLDTGIEGGFEVVGSAAAQLVRCAKV